MNAPFQQVEKITYHFEDQTHSMQVRIGAATIVVPILDDDARKLLTGFKLRFPDNVKMETKASEVVYWLHPEKVDKHEI